MDALDGSPQDRCGWGHHPTPCGQRRLAFVVAGVALACFGYSPGAALAALLRGSFATSEAWNATLLKTGPLLLTGLAVSLCFRCGVWNIGAEGQLYIGALCATWIATRVLPAAPAAILVPSVVLGGPQRVRCGDRSREGCVRCGA